jgi:hypothetical protein
MQLYSYNKLMLNPRIRMKTIPYYELRVGGAVRALYGNWRQEVQGRE